jgi:hypothetical protein
VGDEPLPLFVERPIGAAGFFSELLMLGQELGIRTATMRSCLAQIGRVNVWKGSIRPVSLLPEEGLNQDAREIYTQAIRTEGDEGSKYF